MLKPVWRSTTLRTSTKLRLFNSNVKYILLYGSETWRETASSIKALASELSWELDGQIPSAIKNYGEKHNSNQST